MPTSNRPVRQPGEDLGDFADRVITWKKTKEDVTDLLLATRIRLHGREHKAAELHSEKKSMTFFKNWSKRSTYILIAVIAFFAITNPSLKAFKEHEGDNYEGLSRKYNFLLFSVYNDYGSIYIGICENFICIKENNQPVVTSINTYDPLTDSAKMDSSVSK